jgi:hypothetical protein
MVLVVLWRARNAGRLLCNKILRKYVNSIGWIGHRHFNLSPTSVTLVGTSEQVAAISIHHNQYLAERMSQYDQDKFSLVTRKVEFSFGNCHRGQSGGHLS